MKHLNEIDSIQDLQEHNYSKIKMKHLNEIDSIQDLQEHLKVAMELEHATIPPYMTALYSMNPEKNLDARGAIRVILREEMLHLTNAANILNAIGGKPDLTVAGFVPAYPACLPDGETDFEVGLQGFSNDALDTFLNIERPTPHTGKLGSNAIRMIKRDGNKNHFLPQVEMKTGEVMHFYSIGEFYRAIEKGLEEISKREGEANVFTGKQDLQIQDDKFWGGGGQVTHVNNLASAKKAINLIIDQGEGDRSSIYEDHEEEELSHYYRFEQIKLGKYYKKGDQPGKPTGPDLNVDFSNDAVYPIKGNCKIADCNGDAELETAATEFNELYKKFLGKITVAFNGNPDILGAAIGDMFKIKDKADILMRVPLPGPGNPGLNAAPTFEI